MLMIFMAAWSRLEVEFLDREPSTGFQDPRI